ncbi:MAG: cysteine desulfurase family protein [Patescibacteria group bacterium]|nr:cysteine desulfurase family protein [bacterium]MDZ4240750.1 cysteine desulfurase family protein [Patescibacteria group bacterium]
MPIFPKKKRIFLDYASTTPVLPEIAKVMAPFLQEQFANPSALYKEGVEARAAVSEARLAIARTLGVRKDEIVFTGSGTESINLAILGVANAYKGKRPPHIITTKIEHASVRKAVEEVERMGGKVTAISPNEEGMVSATDVFEAITEDTVLVSVMYANNEIGTIQPIKEIGRTIHEYREARKKKYPYFHTDASQAANYLPVSPSRFYADLMTLDATKMYGPKGVGMLYVKEGTHITPIIHGGGQENGLRSGTENTGAIVGMARALLIAQTDREKEFERLKNLRDYCISQIKKYFPSATINGSATERLPNNANICFPGIDSEFAVISLDAEGIAVSAASSCRTLAERSSSYVIEAIGKKECASSSLRFSFGRFTTKEEVDALLKGLVRRIRSN